MNKKNSITTTIILLIVILTAGLIINNVLAQEGVGQLNQYCGTCVVSTASNSQENSTQQGKNINSKSQGNQNTTGCIGDCDNCTLEDKNGEQLQKQLQEQNREMLQSQSQTTGCTGDCDNCTLEDKNGEQVIADCEFSYEIKGQELKALTIAQIAQKWEIGSENLLGEIVKSFKLSGAYTTENLLDDLRQEYRFSPAQVKTIAQNIKDSL